jgi:hypothetical protein
VEEGGHAKVHERVHGALIPQLLGCWYGQRRRGCAHDECGRIVVWRVFVAAQAEGRAGAADGARESDKGKGERFEATLRASGMQHGVRDANLAVVVGG